MGGGGSGAGKKRSPGRDSAGMDMLRGAATSARKGAGKRQNETAASRLMLAGDGAEAFPWAAEVDAAPGAWCAVGCSAVSGTAM